MLHLGFLGFVHPWLLAAFAALPALWWLLRITPPSPRVLRFPALRLLRGLVQSEETPARTPWWLVLLRLALAAFVILGLAQPLINPRAANTHEGALLIAVDNGWAAAHEWSERQRALSALIEGAARDGRPVMILPTAPPASGDRLEPSKLLAPGDARDYARTLAPQPWPVDRAAAATALEGVKLPEPATVVWLSDGLASEDAAADRAFAARLQSIGPVELLADPPDETPHLLLPPSTQGADFGLTALRAYAGDAETVTVSALDERGHPAGEIALEFGAGQRIALGTLKLPVELRNQVARLEISGDHTAGSTVLLDDRWRRRPVGVVQPAAVEQAEPLLGGHYYLARALRPYSEVVEAP
ncbi:MAG TPA: BatA domain-containing protein, partial [Alphaproteobacteria bacterium]|nr:BatA domain-containing protein [Alphaproteobacteria bacterium]